MKRILAPGILALLVSLMFSSCSKTNDVPPPPQSSATSIPPLNLVASNWSQDANGDYVSTLNDVLNYAPHTEISVYVNDANDPCHIEAGGSSYMDGTISYEEIGSDLIMKYINADPTAPLPFMDLPITIVFK